MVTSKLVAREQRASNLFQLAVVMMAIAVLARIGATQPEQDRAPNAPHHIMLRVRVIDAGHPTRGIKNATVHVLPVGRQPDPWRHPRRVVGPTIDYYGTGRTDSEGRISLNASGIAIDRGVRLWIRAPGFSLGEAVLAPQGWAEREIVIRLVRGAVLTGLVLHADNTPATGAHVFASQPNLGGWLIDERGTMTGSDGKFALTGLAPGWTTIEVIHRVEESVWASRVTADVGGTMVVARLGAAPSRQRVKLKVRGADGLLLHRGEWHETSGQVGLLQGVGEIRGGNSVVPAIPSLQYVELRSSSPDSAGKASGPIVIGPLENQGGILEVRLPRAVRIRGTLRDQFSRPIRQALISAYSLYAEKGSRKRARVASPCATAYTRADGSFDLYPLPADAEIEVRGQRKGVRVSPVRTSTRSGSIFLFGTREEYVSCTVSHPDGQPARNVIVYARPARKNVGAPEGWEQYSTRSDGTTGFVRPQGVAYVLRSALAPLGVEEARESEAIVPSDVDHVSLTTSRVRSLLVRVPQWPQDDLGIAWIMSGPFSRPRAAWIVGGKAKFEGVPAQSTLSIYCGPTRDGLIAFDPKVSSSKAELSVSLTPSKTVQGIASGFPIEAVPERVWADTSEFVAEGDLVEDGRFTIFGVPSGVCRVCVVFRLGEFRWVGSVEHVDSTERLRVKVRRIDFDALDDWVFPRPVK